MEVLDARRLKVLGLTWSRARILLYLVKERKIRNAYSICGPLYSCGMRAWRLWIGSIESILSLRRIRRL